MVAVLVSPALTASTTPAVDEKTKKEQEEKAAEVDPEKKREEEDSFPMSLWLSSPPQKEAEMMWPENDIFESKDLLNLTSGKFEDTTLPLLPLGQGRPSSATTATDVDDDSSTVATVVFVSSSPRKRSFDDTIILSDNEHQ
jgi:hypothetical protein